LAGAVHSALPERLTAIVDAVFRLEGVEHVSHGNRDPVRAAEQAVTAEARALLGPYRSRDVAEAAEVTTPAGVPIVAPVATWVGVTRTDEPGCDDPALNDHTIFRLVARDMVVAQRIAGLGPALVVAGEHEYGVQLNAQLRMAGLERADDAETIVLCGLAGQPEIERVRALSRHTVIAFDGIQGDDLGDHDVLVAMPYAPVNGLAHEDVLAGVANAERAARLVVEADTLDKLRAHPGFDEHGDPVDPPVWLWRGTEPDRELPSTA
jgi:hypothetical protein